MLTHYMYCSSTLHVLNEHKHVLLSHRMQNTCSHTHNIMHVLHVLLSHTYIIYVLHVLQEFMMKKFNIETKQEVRGGGGGGESG